MEPVFIVGPPRSGTTFLRKLINLHPDINILPETHFFSEIYSERNKLFKPTYLNYINRIFKSKGEINQYNSYKNILKSKNFNNSFEIYEMLLSVHKKSKKVKVVGEKFPANFLYYDQIKKVFPNSKFVHISRDPKYSISSYILRKDFPDDYTRMIYYVKKSQEFINKSPNDTFFLDYESLVNNPILELNKIFNFLNLNNDVDEKSLNTIPFSSSINKSGGSLIDYDLQGIRKGNQREWTEGLNNEDIKIIKSINFNKKFTALFNLNIKLLIEHFKTYKRKIGLRKLI